MLLVPREVGCFLSALSTPGDDLFAWANQGGFNFYSELPLKASRTIFHHHLNGIPGENERLQEHFEKNPPTYVVVAHRPNFGEAPDWLKLELKNNYEMIGRFGRKKNYAIFKNHPS